ncbi:hypothetical protein Tco_1417902 [Tanacetum coccineum]
MFGFDQRVFALEKELSQLKQADYSVKLLKTIKSQIPTMVNAQLSTRLEDSINKSFRSYTAEFEKKAKDERKRYIDLVKKSVKEIIKDEVKNQLPKILLKEVSDYATPVIQISITESLENIVLAKSSSQPKSIYEAVASLTEFELKKILLDKIQKIKSHRGAQEHKDLYDALVKSYKLEKDFFESYGKVYSLKRDQEDKDKDEDPLAGSDQGLKKRKTSKDCAQAKEPVFETADTKMPLNQGEDLGNTNDQPNVKVTLKDDWFKKPERPPTPDSDWNTTKSIDFRPPQTWISKITKAGKPPLTFDELMSTPIDFSAYVMNNLKIENLTQEHLVGLAFNLLKGTCKSRVELEYHFEECCKAVIDRLDWTNPKGHEYPFYLSKPLPLIENQGRQVVLANYFINNDLEYLKGGSSRRKYTTSTTKTKVAKYDTLEGIEDMVPSLWSPVKLAYDKYAIWGITYWVTHVKVMKWYDYEYLEEIIVRREDQQLYKFKEDVIYELNVALRMFTRRVVILKRVEDLQLGVESYQKKLNITRLETFRSMRSDELYKFCDGTLTSVRRVLHDIASNLEMDYLPKRRWSKLDRKRSRIMIKAIDQQLFERRLIRNLEKFVGGRDYGNDLRLLERTI